VKSKATLFHKTKLILDSGLVREVVIWRILKSVDYPDGFRYRLLLADPISKKVLLLFDNHAPKGHHYHNSNGEEFFNQFVSLEILLKDFFKLASEEEETYENAKNQNSR